MGMNPGGSCPSGRLIGAVLPVGNGTIEGVGCAWTCESECECECEWEGRGTGRLASSGLSRYGRCPVAVICEILDEGRDYISPDICQQLGLKKNIKG
jgi:hypothetical protein